MGEDIGSTAVELASMKQSMGHMMQSMDRLEISINGLLTRNDKITELVIHSEGHSKEIATLWVKFDALKSAKDTDHDEFKKFIDSSKGAMGIMKLFLIVFGAGITTAIGWVFYEVTVAVTILAVHTDQITQLAKSVGIGH